jgi:hypothetical protein
MATAGHGWPRLAKTIMSAGCLPKGDTSNAPSVIARVVSKTEKQRDGDTERRERRKRKVCRVVNFRSAELFSHERRHCAKCLDTTAMQSQYERRVCEGDVVTTFRYKERAATAPSVFTRRRCKDCERDGCVRATL